MPESEPSAKPLHTAADDLTDSRSDYFETFYRSRTKPITKVTLDYLFQDPSVSSNPVTGTSPTLPLFIEDTLGFHDGPTCSRVAVIDLDLATGKVRPPVELLATRSRGSEHIGTYRCTAPTDVYHALIDQRDGVKSALGNSPADLSHPDYNGAFIRVTTFGLVMATLELVEGTDCLGHKVEWAFAGPQLLVIPLAAEMPNAFYERESRSLQFYYFPTSDDRIVRTALSSDIVAHETGHAIVDGIAPALYDSVTPQSLAIHESIADLIAVLVSLGNWQTFHAETSSDIPDLKTSNLHSKVAEQFGLWRGHGPALRDTCNSFALNSDDIESVDPHSLSQVLSGILYSTLASELDRKFSDSRAQTDRDQRSVTWTRNRIGSLIFRGLEWMPPGDVSFADLISSMFTADVWRLPHRSHARDRLIREANQRQVRVETPEPPKERKVSRVPRTARGAHSMISREADLFGAPHDLELADIEVRQVKSAKTELTGQHIPTPVTLIKASWPAAEPNQLDSRWPETRIRRDGMTIAIRDDRTVLAILHNSGGRALVEDRERFLRKLASTGMLEAPGSTVGHGMSSIVTDQTVRFHGALRTLHISAQDS